jgi:hypothetical protein
MGVLDQARIDWQKIRDLLKPDPWWTLDEMADSLDIPKDRIKTAFDVYSGWWDSRSRKVRDGVTDTEFALR